MYPGEHYHQLEGKQIVLSVKIVLGFPHCAACTKIILINRVLLLLTPNLEVYSLESYVSPIKISSLTHTLSIKSEVNNLLHHILTYTSC